MRVRSDPRSICLWPSALTVARRSASVSGPSVPLMSRSWRVCSPCAGTRPVDRQGGDAVERGPEQFGACLAFGGVLGQCFHECVEGCEQRRRRVLADELQLRGCDEHGLVEGRVFEDERRWARHAARRPRCGSRRLPVIDMREILALLDIGL